MANLSSTMSSSMNDSRDETDSNNGGRQLNEKFFKELFKKEWKLYYRTPELNEKLYLHYKGILISNNLISFVWKFINKCRRVYKDPEFGTIYRLEVPLF